MRRGPVTCGIHWGVSIAPIDCLATVAAFGWRRAFAVRRRASVTRRARPPRLRRMDRLERLLHAPGLREAHLADSSPRRMTLSFAVDTAVFVTGLVHLVHTYIGDP